MTEDGRRLSPALSHTVEIAICTMLGVVMYVSKIVLEFLPNVHLVAVLTVTYTVVFRTKALIPVYVYAFLVLENYGYQFQWWVPNLYIWTILWAVAMLLPRKMPLWIAPIVYAVVCGLHGFLYGTMWAPWQALVFGLDFKGMVTWIAAGLPYDVTHGISNTVLGAVLVLPLTAALKRAVRYAR